MTPNAFIARACACIVATASVVCSAPASAQAQQAFPNRAVKLIVSTSPGGSGDMLARGIADKLSAMWGQPVVVEQRTGANGLIATNALVKAPPDGHTAFLSLSSLVQNLLLQSNPGYKMGDLAPVTMVSINPMAIAVGSGTQATTVDELLKVARQDPGKVSYGTFGTGSSAHVIGAGLARAAQVQMVHVPYKGESASFPDLASGQLSMSFGTVGFYSAQAAGGKIRILAVTSPHRLKKYPNVPTLSEAGYPDVNLAGWFGVFLPAATPKAIVDKFSADVRRAIAMPDLQARIYEMGLEPVGDTPAEFELKLKSELSHWTKAISDTGIKLD
jgi:tripartite-type tricarboxylate transporter receptor subunit TctC